MKLSLFKYDLPEKLIALNPCKNRDESRLMVVCRSTGKIQHKKFKDFINYFNNEDTLVINDTKVFQSVLYGRKEKTGAEIEVFLLRELNKDLYLWDTLVEPARKIRVGNKLFFGNQNNLVAEVLDNTTSRGRTIKFLFNGSSSEFYNKINMLGCTPIPKNIKRFVKSDDKLRYQTIYAKYPGAVAAPAAGFHFTPHILKKLKINGINIASITNHIGLGTLKIVDVEDLTKYRVDSERFEILENSVNIINETLKKNKKVCAIGVSSIKSLESSISVLGKLRSKKDWTNKFIFPPYDFKVCNALLTNFHLPSSILLMTTSAFGGYDIIMNAYNVAIKEKYRFFIYGDAMLII